MTRPAIQPGVHPQRCLTVHIPTLAPKVYAELNELYPSVMAATDYPSLPDNQTSWHNIHNFRNELAYQLKPFGISASVKTDYDPMPASKTISKGYLWPRISGFCYWPTKKNSRARIEIQLHHLPGQRRFAITTTRREQLRFRILLILAHELIHRHQMDYRSITATTFNPSRVLLGTNNTDDLTKEEQQDQRYLADYDEIEAYAHDTVQELWYYGQIQGVDVSGPKLLKAAKAVFYEQDDKSPLIYPLWMYNQTFGGDSSHPAVQALFRKIRAWGKVGIPISVS